MTRSGTARLEGKVGVVTGAASGIGRAIARRFVAEGAAVVGGDVDAAGLDALASELGDRFVAAPGDVTVEDDQVALFATAADRFGRVDVAVANAGVGHFAPIVDHDLADWKRVIDLCLTGVMLTMKHAGRAMTAGGGGDGGDGGGGRGGSIIAMASLNAVQPAGGMGAYCSSKAAVAMLAQVAAMELGPRGIRVNAIGPGLVQTGLTAPMWSLPGLVEEFVENTTVGRFAQPEDVADLALFLASDESTFVTGGLYLVDGGAHTMRYPNIFASFTAAAAAAADRSVH
jgi:NAD(P)-dependent dehydrogenase (short-subunit alcohol dehydrogenase family)